MHDPMTVAFEIRYPWRSVGGYRRSLVTIWHVDPERDGIDDSCGWFAPKLSEDQKRRIESIAADEAREPWYQKYTAKQIYSAAEAETLVREAFFLVGRILSRQHLCKPPVKPVTFAEASEWACDMLCCPVDNLRSSLSFLAGYHSNFDEDRESDRQYTAERFFWCVARYVLRKRRTWYKHPRWHLWHWSIQVHPLQQLKRWAFSRCAKCGKGFAYGELPISGSWDSEGPKWFRSEKNIWHSGCDESAKPANSVPV